MPRAGAGSAAAKKGRAPKAHKLPERFPSGEILYQPSDKRSWQLGDVIGQGGFGLIYKASDVTDPPSADPRYVIKIEPQDNGPLFCELHFYQRAAKPDSINEWIRVKKLKYLGVPQFLGTGLHKKGDKQYRFVAMQRLSKDLQKVFEENGRLFSEKTAYSVGIRMLDALEYIHDKGYCHADIKAANILLGHNNGKEDANQVYLVDYGLAYRYLVDGAHKPYKEDPKRAHDGTAEYTSRDAHKGVYPSRRGDLEILGYCMLEWLAGSLPWSNVLLDKDRVANLKMQYMNDVAGLMKACFGTVQCPEGLKKYLSVVSKLAYDEKPDYNQLRQFLRSGAQNEWTLGLPDGASQAKGTKRKNDAPDVLSPKVAKIRAGSAPSPSRKPAGAKAGAAKGGKRKSDSGDMASPRATRVASPEPLYEPGEMTGSPSKSKRSKPAVSNGKSTPASARKSKATKVKEAASSSTGKIPGAARGRGRPAKVTAGASKSPKAKKATSSPGMAKVQARTPQKAGPAKRKRNKAVTSSDTAVQTSPGFVLMANGSQ